ncbi:integrase family protein [Alteromonas pelagimontana]|uniref:Integrase family protein n=1 Tax=Alteromonas pelagimontana TaxID=1858656 RepID=A0A6M4MEU0_9ALTE|nr:integrase family protein [Alteromonas pelagimontana]QJR81694.1 integrase family protein [Alteromonas pelagimontana]
MIEKAQHIEAAIRAFKTGNSKHRQQDITVVCNDLIRGMGTLVLQVSTTGSATFRYIQKVAGKRSYSVIGTYSKNGRGGITLAQARQVALEYGALAKRGINVKEHLSNERDKQETLKRLEADQLRSGSFGQLIDSYITTMQVEGKRTWHRVLASIEKDVYPLISPEQKAATVTDTQIIQVLAKMIDRGADTQANRVRSYLHTAFRNGLKHDKDPAKQHTSVLFALQGNPVAGVPRQGGAERVGNRHLDKLELKKLLELLDRCSGISMWSANIIKLCIFTGGQRPYEIVTLKPGCVDFGYSLIEVSENYSKNKTSHLIPLTNSALSIVQWFYERSLNYDADFLIYKGTNLTEHYRTDSLSTAISRFCAANDFAHFTPRDIRRTVKTLMGSIGLSKEIRDRIQNHAFGDTSSKHYDRWEYLPEKRAALEKWEKWYLSLR